MSYTFSPDVSELIKEQMAVGGYASEDDLLRDALTMLRQFNFSRSDAETEYHQTVEAIRESLDDLKAGRVTPLRDLLEENVDQSRD